METKKILIIISIGLYLGMIFLMFWTNIFSDNVFYGSIFIGLGIFPLSLSLSWAYTIMKCRSWVKYSGTVISSKVISEIIPLQIDFMSVKKYTPAISYKYYIDSKMFTSTNLSPIDNDFRFSLEQDVKKIIKYFSKGGDIDVWVNPKKKSQSIIIQGCSKDKGTQIFGYIIIAVLLFSIGLFIMKF